MNSKSILFAAILTASAGCLCPAQPPAEPLATVPGAAAPAAAATGTGVLTGTVSDSSTHQPVPLAVITVERQPDAPQKNKPAPQVVVSTRTARTAQDGTFTIPNLPAGTYQICVHAMAGQWLNPCAWNNNPPSADLKDSKTTDSGNIKLDKGTVLKLRLEDATQSALATINTKPGTELVVGVRSKHGMFIKPKEVSRDATGINYESLVPSGTAVMLSVLGKNFKLADPDGKAVAQATSAIPVTVPSSVSETTIKLTIIGHN